MSASPDDHRSSPAANASAPAGRPLRVVMIGKPGPENDYLVDLLGSRGLLDRLLVPTYAPTPPRSLGWARGRLAGLRPASLVRLARREVLQRLDARLEDDLRRRLPPTGPTTVPTQAIAAPDLDGERGRALLVELAPDVLILSVAPMIKPSIYTVPRLGTVNLHWGIAQRYRGVASVFTALRRHDHEHIGLTVHHVDDRSDTGPVVAQGWPALEPGDTEASITAKMTVLAGDLLIDLLDRAPYAGLPAELQQGTGELVRHRDRRVRHHLRLAAERRVLGRRPPARTQRVHRAAPAATNGRSGATVGPDTSTPVVAPSPDPRA